MAAAVRAAHVEVDCRRWEGPLRRIWTSFGYDELNWTATPRGKQNLATLHAFMETPYTVRAHNLYTSGTGRGLPHWSSGNVYHEDSTGRPLYDWTHGMLTHDGRRHRRFKRSANSSSVICPFASAAATAVRRAAKLSRAL